ncbi:Disease resistance protein RPM1 [Glycine max]|nr:Disease resistance protein RPM1 [Glycine max]
MMIFSEEKQPEDDPRCAALLCEAIAYKIQDAKSLVRVERDGFRSYFPSEKRTNNSRGNQNVTWLKLRMDPFFIEEDQIVDLDDPRYRLRKGRKEPSVISVVGILRVGKTTLSKQVFDQVHNDFECHALITMSQSYTVQELLRDITNNLCKEKTEDPPKDVSTMDQRLFTEESKKPLGMLSCLMTSRMKHFVITLNLL